MENGLKGSRSFFSHFHKNLSNVTVNLLLKAISKEITICLCKEKTFKIPNIRNSYLKDKFGHRCLTRQKNVIRCGLMVINFLSYLDFVAQLLT